MTPITFNLANLTDPENRVPLFRQYAGQMQPQGAHVYLSQHGEVSADYRADVGNACRSPDEWHKVTLSWPVSPCAKGEALADLLQGSALPLLEAVHAGHVAEWDGCNWRGRLNAPAEAAWFDLAELLAEKFEGDPSNRVSVWSMEEWLFSSNSLRNLWSGRPLAEVVAELEAEIKREAEDNEVNGDVTTALLDRAAHEFDDDDLDAHHLAALVEAGRITQAQADARTVPPVRLYHVHVTNDATQRTARMTAYPATHAEACTIMDKITKSAGRRVHLVEVQEGGAA